MISSTQAEQENSTQFQFSLTMASPLDKISWGQVAKQLMKGSRFRIFAGNIPPQLIFFQRINNPFSPMFL